MSCKCVSWDSLGLKGDLYALIVLGEQNTHQFVLIILTTCLVNMFDSNGVIVVIKSFKDNSNFLSASLRKLRGRKCRCQSRIN